MTLYRVITESGADYQIDTVHHFWNHRGHFHGKYWKFQVNRVSEADYLHLPWSNPDDWEDATEPILGRRMYLSSPNDWRISTPVVSIEVVEENK